MILYSTNGKSPEVGFKEALFNPLAPDGGLYMPRQWPAVPDALLQSFEGKPFAEVAAGLAGLFMNGELPQDQLEALCHEAFDFPMPLVEVAPDVYVLELIHGPTYAFKDVGARFMARVMSALLQEDDRQITLLVATSGDTGGAVAAGFHGVPNIRVIILYPEGMVSHVQEQQLNQYEGNVTAFRVQGTFDDCQAMVKAAFADKELASQLNLTSANSINIARLLPQIFYYYYAFSQLPRRQKHLAFSVPSGNFGNVCAGLFAIRTGLPADIMVAATNANLTVPEYRHTHRYTPRAAVQTLSSAMDVGNPSNFARILDLFGHDAIVLCQHLYSQGFSDKETIAAMEEIWRRHQYLMEPHTAVGYLGLEDYRRRFGGKMTGIVLATAHPAKFLEVMPADLRGHVHVPLPLQALASQNRQGRRIAPSLQALKEQLLVDMQA